ncbi:MAG: AAC(3) family N-acetyltransferase [Armatimonadetes bacterium]|nr:AAC(3) family N-acetyltransferase [Armatimonadota bacterium]
MTLTRQDIVDDLRALGVGPGMTLMVHSSLSAIGRVEGGAGTVIEALLEALGPEGTLAMPAMSSGVYDHEKSPSNVGTITEVFRTWPGVKRGFHPSHSACAIGPNADYLLDDILDQPTAIGTESPWGRLARLNNGYILLLGVDQDRNTILHYPEEIVRAPYLSDKECQYLDPETGEVKSIVYHWFPGPHRDFIGLEPALRESRAMKIGKVGRALCRLMHAGDTVEIVTAELRRDPAAVLCDNPNCDDCVMQRAKIKAHDLAQYDFHASALLDELVDDLNEAGTGGEHAGGLQAIWNEGIRCVELGPVLGDQLISDAATRTSLAAELAERDMTVSCLHCGLTPEQFMGDGVAGRIEAAARIAAEMEIPLLKVPSPPSGTDPADAIGRLREAAGAVADTGVTLVFENVPESCWDTGENCDAPLLELADEHQVGFAFNPAHFANVGEKPFLGTYRRTKLKRFTRIIYACDGCVPGRTRYTPLIGGNGEVKEVISIFRCRSFDGFVTLKMGDRRGTEAFASHAAAFRRLLETS